MKLEVCGYVSVQLISTGGDGVPAPEGGERDCLHKLPFSAPSLHRTSMLKSLAVSLYYLCSYIIPVLQAHVQDKEHL